MPDKNLSANITIKTLITKRNIPNVRMVIGKVSMIKNGFTIVFKTPKINTKIKADQ